MRDQILNFLTNRISAELTVKCYEDAVATTEQGLAIVRDRDTDQEDHRIFKTCITDPKPDHR